MDKKLVELRNTLASVIEGMSPADLAVHADGKWSSAEILDHLNLTYLGTIKNFERTLASGKWGTTEDRKRKRWQRRTVVWLGIFPPGRKSPAPVAPRGTPSEQLTNEIFDNIVHMDKAIALCDARFGRGKPIAIHPVLGPLTASEWRKFHLVHGRHHAQQILRLKKRN